MLKLTSFFALIFVSTFVVNAQSQVIPSTCPDMNGHFKYSKLVAKADGYVTQTACDSMSIVVNANILGTAYNISVQSPLDGVTRPAPPYAANETDTISGKWNGDTANFTVDRYITGSNGSITHTTNLITGTLTTPNNLQVQDSDVDASGNLSNTETYNFTRVQ